MLSQLWVRAQVSDGPKVLQTFRRSKPTLAASSEAVKDFQEIPSPPGWPLLGNLFAMMKNGSRLDKYFAELHAQYGDMVRLRIPMGSSNSRMLVLFKPGEMKSIYTEEERIPKLPGLEEYLFYFNSLTFTLLGFDVLEYSRKFDLKSRFKSKGLITNSVRNETRSFQSQLSVSVLLL